MRIVNNIHHLKSGDLIAVVFLDIWLGFRLDDGETLKEVFKQYIEKDSALVLYRYGVNDDGEWDDKDGWEEGSGVEPPPWVGDPMLEIQYLTPRNQRLKEEIFAYDKEGPGLYVQRNGAEHPVSILLISQADDPE
jgi:hypothetical protein